MARQLGVSVDTVRYYEKAGLADPPARDAGGRRRYADADVAWLVFLVRMRSTGMGVALLADYAAARRLGPASAGVRRAILHRHRADVAARVAELTSCLTLIDQKIDDFARLEAYLAETTTPHQEEAPA